MNGSQHGRCLNCGASLANRYCPQCGQDSHVRLTVRHFFEEFVEGVMHFDSTFWRTFTPLLFKPGLLSREYLSGRRKFYAPPLRSYLVLSVLYFLLASAAATQTRVVDLKGNELTPRDCAQLASQAAFLHRFIPDVQGACVRALSDGGHALDRALNGMLPKVMFAVLPLVALVQYWLYRRRQPLYIANLVFILHFQSFYFLTGALLLLLALGLAAIFQTSPHDISSSLDVALYAWAAAYLLIANRRVYEVSRLRAIASVLVIALAYFIFWGIGVSVAGFYAFLHA